MKYEYKVVYGNEVQKFVNFINENAKEGFRVVSSQVQVLDHTVTHPVFYALMEREVAP